MEEFYLIVIIAVAVVAGLFYSRWISRRVRRIESIINRMKK